MTSDLDEFTNKNREKEYLKKAQRDIKKKIQKKQELLDKKTQNNNIKDDPTDIILWALTTIQAIGIYEIIILSISIIPYYTLGRDSVITAIQISQIGIIAIIYKFYKIRKEIK